MQKINEKNGEGNKESRFGTVFYKLILIFLVLFAILLFVLGIILTPNFFKSYSQDGVLKDSTISKIFNLRIALFLISIFIIIVTFILGRLEFQIKDVITKRKQIILNLMLLAFVIILILIVGEIACRVMYYDKTSAGGYGPGSIKFNQLHVRLNSDGMRDREFSIEKPNNTIRIAVIGDSFTFGAGVKNVNDTYPKVLERKLNNLSDGKNYEVLNFGVGGYDAPEELDALKNKAVKYRPDVIVIGYVLNDLIDIDPNVTKASNMIDLPYVGFWMRSISYLYYFVQTKTQKIYESLTHKPRFEQILVERYNSEIDKNYTKGFYREMSDISKSNNASVILFVFPMISGLNNYSFLDAHSFAKDIAQENNFKFTDLLTEYKKHNESELVVNREDSHPNALGQRIAAEKILEMFINKT